MPNIWMNKKSEHKRYKWFGKVCKKYVNQQFIYPIVNDFLISVVKLKSHELINKNVSRYDCYIIRL